MALCQLFIQPEAAYTSVSELGEAGSVQFRDVSINKCAEFQSTVSNIRKRSGFWTVIDTRQLTSVEDIEWRHNIGWSYNYPYSSTERQPMVLIYTHWYIHIYTWCSFIHLILLFPFQHNLTRSFPNPNSCLNQTFCCPVRYACGKNVIKNLPALISSFLECLLGTAYH